MGLECSTDVKNVPGSESQTIVNVLTMQLYVESNTMHIVPVRFSVSVVINTYTV